MPSPWRRSPLELADRCPDDWRALFDTDAEAARELDRLKSEVAWLTSTVRASLDAARSRSRYAGTVNFWIDVSVAGPPVPHQQRTGAGDQRVRSCAEPRPEFQAARRSITRAARDAPRSRHSREKRRRPLLHLLAGPPDPRRLGPAAPSARLLRPHDRRAGPGRTRAFRPARRERRQGSGSSRPSQEIAAAAAARQERIVGLAGVSDGGDLLFHEACHRAWRGDPGVACRFLSWSTAPRPCRGQPSRWADRYHAALRNAVCGASPWPAPTRCPDGCRARPDYSTWQRNNRWILHHAWATTTSGRVTVLALWNGEPGDGPGGVADMVATAQARGAEVVAWRPATLFGLSTPELPTPELPAPAADTASGPGAEQAPPGTDIGAGQSAITAPGDDAELAGGDRVLNLLWSSHRQWSLAADAAQSRLNQWRQRTLALLVAGPWPAALAAQTWLSSSVISAAAAASAPPCSRSPRGSRVWHSPQTRPSAGRAPGPPPRP